MVESRGRETRTLVTGGGGFIGTHVVRRLVENGHRVRVLGRRRYPHLEQLGVEVVRGDVADADFVARACEEIDVVHHIAACVGVSRPAERQIRTNVLGTRNVVESCVGHGVRRLVFTSSASVVFANRDQEGVDESAPYPGRVTSVYARSKAEGERLVLEADGRNGLRTVSLRPHLVWGPGDWFLPELLDLARRGRLVQIGDGDNLVDVTYVENLADAHLLAAKQLRGEAPAGGRAFFISQGEPVELWDFLGSLLDRLGIPRPTRSISYRTAYLLGFLAEAFSKIRRSRTGPRLTRFVAAQMARSHYYDISAAREVLGYRPGVSTAEGLDRLVAFLNVSGGAADR